MFETKLDVNLILARAALIHPNHPSKSTLSNGDFTLRPMLTPKLWSLTIFPL